jgi:hypothetical protein
VDSNLFKKYIDKVKQLCEGERIEHFMQYVSLDTGNSEHAEYIRDGLHYFRCMSYAHQFLTDIPYRNSLTFIITMNNLNILGLRQLLESILEMRKKYSSTYQRVWFDTPLLRSPTYQSLQILPASYVRILEDVVTFMRANQADETADNFEGFKDYEIQRMERNVEWMKQGCELAADYVTIQRADFYKFFNEYDKRRGLIFLETFPQMKEFWQECKYHAENS